MRLRPGAPHAGRRHVNQVGIDRAQRFSAETEPVHHAGCEVFHQHVAGSRQCARRLHVLRPFQVQHDGLLRLTEHGVQFGRAAWVAAAGASTLITSAPIAAK